MDRIAPSPRRPLYVWTRNVFILFILTGISGCVATRGWVYEQLILMEQRVDDVDTRTELALQNLENLRLEQHLVLGGQEGTNFDTDSARLTPQAQRAIDDFLQVLPEPDEAIFLVAGHTDTTGPEDYNYALGQKRAASVAQYLITAKGIHPMRVTAVSFGERTPVADEHTAEGRFRNRRVEIQVYQQSISSAPGPQRIEFDRRGTAQEQPDKEIAHGRH
jgi:outer membrane protein OmpA-like peptidoglycan-associated protein